MTKKQRQKFINLMDGKTTKGCLDDKELLDFYLKNSKADGDLKQRFKLTVTILKGV